MDFGLQMAWAARLACNFPQVGAQLRDRYRVVLLDEYQDTGHAQRVALSALFGGGVDDELALTAVGDPIQSIYGWRGASATNLPRFATDFPDQTARPRRSSSCAPAGATRRGSCRWPTPCRRRRGVDRSRCEPCGPAGAPRARFGWRCCPMCRPNASGSPTICTTGISGAAPRASRRQPPRYSCGETPTRRQWPRRCGAAACRWRWWGWRVCCPFLRSPTWWRCCDWSPTRPRGQRRCGC
ncbi:uvrD/REP helicase N-terminal domain protein [Mycobacterium xenopi 3993]|nr:uvrD/REP helicase N-terminal domain protein [Mycobacterium xenopi 3993]